jgi:hypothetical protein
MKMVTGSVHPSAIDFSIVDIVMSWPTMSVLFAQIAKLQLKFHQKPELTALAKLPGIAGWAVICSLGSDAYLLREFMKRLTQFEVSFALSEELFGWKKEVGSLKGCKIFAHLLLV